MDTVLRVAHVVHGTRCEGPGLRTAVWVQGCSIRCPGCCNPELFTTRGGRDQTPAQILAGRGDAEGITVLGGEPFEQPAGLAALARTARDAGLSVVVFTGFVREELPPTAAAALAAIDVLVDGPYDRTRPDTVRPWVGSTNQRVHHLTDRYGPADFEGRRSVELRYRDGVLTVVGWPL